MKDFIMKIKFEHVFITLMLFIGTTFYFFPVENEVSLAIVAMLTGGFGTVLGYIFGKSRPDEKEEK